ncbi:MAG: hypothetical protein NVS9B15_08070 [Acidobacteriaceae bacterium]
MQPQRQVATNDDEPIFGLRLFTAIYAGFVMIMIPLWLCAAHFASQQSRTFLAKSLYLIVGAGFLVALKFLGLERQYDLAFGTVAVLVNAFVYGVVVWLFAMAARMLRAQT